MQAVLENPKVETVQATRIDSLAITYPIGTKEIAMMRAKYSGLKADTKEGYEQVRLAIADTREMRGKIEKRRKELKADHLEFGRKVDSVAKFLTQEIEAIEEPLALLKGEVDDAKAREKAAKEAAERAKVEAELKAKQEAEQLRLKQEREAEEARLKVIRDAEEARLREEQAKLKAEREAMEAKQRELEAERQKAEAEAKERQAKIDAENAEKQRLIDEANRKLEEERKALEAAKQKAEREEFERQAKLKAEEEAKAKMERERIEAEAAKRAEAERILAQQQEADARKSDVTRVHEFAAAIRALTAPVVKSESAADFIDTAVCQLANIAEVLESFEA